MIWVLEILFRNSDYKSKLLAFFETVLYMELLRNPDYRLSVSLSKYVSIGLCYRIWNC